MYVYHRKPFVIKEQSKNVEKNRETIWGMKDNFSGNKIKQEYKMKKKRGEYNKKFMYIGKK